MSDNNPYTSSSLDPKRTPVDLTPPTPKKAIARVTTGKIVVKKPSFLDKVSELFLGDDADTVGKYLIYDVLIPAAKNTLFDAIKIGAEMLLFGETTKKLGVKNNRNDTVISYNTISAVNPLRPHQDTIRRPGRGVALITMETRRDAQHVLDLMLEAIDVYGSVNVAEYYAAAGYQSDFTDNNYGWANLSTARVTQTRGGWTIELPRPLPFKD